MTETLLQQPLHWPLQHEGGRQITRVDESVAGGGLSASENFTRT